MTNRLKIPEMSLVVMVGASGSGKSTFASKHFKPTEVLSSDAFRAWVSDDLDDQSATQDAFDALHHLADIRLRRGRLTVIDATNVQQSSRASLIALARRHHVLPVAIVLNPPQSVCIQRHEDRPDRNFGRHVIVRQMTQLRSSLGSLRNEGFRQVFILDGLDDVESVEIQRTRLYNDRRDDHGPFDIIGDVHGCADELEALLEKLGYVTETANTAAANPEAATPESANTASVETINGPLYRHPEGRRALFVGDLVDRGPRTVDVLKLVRTMVEAGTGVCVMGNHDFKLKKALSGARVNAKHGLQESLDQFAALPDDQREATTLAMRRFLESLVSHYVLDDGRLVVAHAGLKESMHGRASGAVRNYCMFGETTGELDDDGLPERIDWAADYRGDALVVYGHTPVARPRWLNNTVNIDTGCVFGGKLTALRYPEREIVHVPAMQAYSETSRNFLTPATATNAQQQADRLLDLADCIGKQRIHTDLAATVTIEQANATAALEIMSRFATDPRWLIYLPPTMSPCETSRVDGYLEHPHEAFEYYRRAGVQSVVCQQKHMGSRAVVTLCRDSKAAIERFGVTHESGCIVTRTGRRFFDDLAFEQQLLRHVRDACTQSDLWGRLETEWLCLDCELMPWSVKANQLVREQYAAVGAAGRASLSRGAELLTAATKRLQSDDRTLAESLLQRIEGHRANVDRMTAAYRPYCWPVSSVNDLRLAPFHLLATEGHVHADQDHLWHMQEIAKLCNQPPETSQVLQMTDWRLVDLSDESACDAATEWWDAYTNTGGEGMVVKPRQFVVRDKQGRTLQPAIKCRGREYLRIIYGPDYDYPETLERLRNRGLARKRSLAMREFALGIEGLQRFVDYQPLRKVHQCPFAVLALESEPVDPRL